MHRDRTRDGMLPTIHEIETTVLVDQKDVDPELLQIGDVHRWNIRSLQDWALNNYDTDIMYRPSVSTRDSKCTFMSKIAIASFPFLLCFAIVLAFTCLNSNGVSSHLIRLQEL